ncbi:TIR domain-containing protein [Sorangium sp. So ce295]|uniref:beta-propeller domain-containing protein n=1 Tax=Sorangium sp. So ce295 TaxID=3133295 RepID=UPI003F64273D
MARELIDFGIERSRHEHFFGREDVLAAIDRHLDGAGASGRWVLVTGGPGMGKSAILSRWLDAEEQRGRGAPHHFLRRDVMDWDRPEAVVRSLSAQIEALFPAQKDPDARPESRLIELLAKVSKHELAPRGERLVLVIDGLDEARSDGAGQNPLPGFLPYALPPRVHALCASRPQYPHLDWLESRGNVRRVDLDAPAWASSNEQACRAFWGDQAPRFTPRLDPRLVEEAVARAEGNLLYAVKLREWLEEQPIAQRRVERLPRGLSGFLEQIWRQLRGLPREQFGLVTNGLGLVCAAREALPLEEIEAAWGWQGMEAGEDFLHAARALLLEEPASWRGARAYRPYHEAFRAFVADKLGPKRMAELHRRLLETTARWPLAGDASDFQRRYAVRHAIPHALTAGEQEKARWFCRDLGLLEALCREDGPAAIEDALRLAARVLNDGELDLLYRAVRAESHWLRESPEALPELVYNRLRSAGWEAHRIAMAVRFPRGLPKLRLRHPVRMWTGEERTLSGHADWVNACAISPDAQRIVSASDDGTLKVWELSTGRLLSTLQGHAKGVNKGVKSCALSPDGQRVVSASGDGTLKVWELSTGRLLSTLQGHVHGVSDCAISPDGQRVVSAAADWTLKVWDLATGQPLATLQGHAMGVRSCAISPDGQRIVSSSADRTLKVWELATGRLLSTLEGHSDWVNACAVSPDGRHIVSASSDRTLKVWDLATGQPVATLHGHARGVRSCAISPDGQRIVSGAADRTLKIWELATGRLLSTLEGHSDWITACAVSPDGRRAISAAGDRTLKVWDLAAGQLLPSLHGHSGWIYACAISPDGQRVVSASDDETLKVWDVSSGRLLATLAGHSRWVRGCAISPDGQRIVSTSDDSTLKIWEPATGQLLSTLEGHAHGVNACAISPDGQRIVSASGDTTLKIWELATGQLLSTLEDHADWVNACAISPDGQRIVSASGDRTLKVWELATGRLLSTLEGHAKWVNACAISPDGQRVVSASLDGTLKVWELATGQLHFTLEGHADGVNACAVSSDGQHIIAAGNDGKLRFWDAATGARADTAHGMGPFACVAASRELVCAGDASGNLWLIERSASTPSRDASATPRPTRLFFSYSHKDEALRDELETHLALLEREGLLDSWHDRRVAAGDAWADRIDRNLEEADVVLLLVSASFLASDSCIDHEMRRALERHDAGQARVIPVLLRPTDWHSAPFARLQALPNNGKPVTLWENRDEAWTDVVKGIRRAVSELRARFG